jgi:hypothetical protein
MAHSWHTARKKPPLAPAVPFCAIATRGQPEARYSLAFVVFASH